MPLSADQFAKAVIAAGLSSADEIKTLWNSLPANTRPKDGETFAKLLIEREKLTQYQAGELLSGSTTPLALGDYVLLAKIGAGGMGQVFKAHHRRMKRLAAIKLLPSALTKDEDAIKRFEREVEAAAKLSHPNIVQTHDAGVQRGVWYLVMEYVEGRDLSEVLAAEGPLPIALAVNHIRQAANGLAYAHENGVVHRDIKPSNLLLDKKSVIKILDMGLARLDGEVAAKEGLTQSGQVMGTVDYMAPEQAFDTRHADARADIYSLGCTLFRLLTNTNMYVGETLVQKLMAHQQQPIPSLRERRPEVSAELEAVFRKMVAKKPEERYQTMTEVEAALGSVSPAGFVGQTMPSAASSPTPPATTTKPGKAPGLAATATLAPPTPDGHAPTISLSHPLQATDPVSQHTIDFARDSVASQVAGNPPAKRPPWKLIAAGLGGALLIALAVWVIIRDKDGKEVGRVKVPEGGKIEIVDGNDATKVVEPPNVPGLSAAGGASPASALASASPLPPGPLDKLDPKNIPAAEQFPWQPKELVAVIGEHRRRHAGPIQQVAYSGDGRWIASISSSSGLLLIDAETLEEKLRPGPNASSGEGVLFTPDGKSLVATIRESVVLWDVSGTTPHERAKIPVNGFRLAITHDGQKLAVLEHPGWIFSRWDLSGAAPKEIGRRVQAGGGGLIAMAPDGKTMASNSGVRLWDLTGEQPTEKAGITYTAPGAGGLVFSPDSKSLLTSAHDAVRIWDVTQKSPTERASLPASIGDFGHGDNLKFSGDGSKLAVGNKDVRICSWDGSVATPTIVVRNASTAKLALSPDGTTLVGGDYGGNMRIWDLKSDPPVEREPLSPPYMRAIAFSPDGTRFVAAKDNDKIDVWNLTSVPPARLPGTTTKSVGAIDGFSFTPDSSQLIGRGSQDSSLWSVGRTSFQQQSLLGQTLGWSDGRSVLSLTRVAKDQDCKIKQWELAGGVLQPVRDLSAPRLYSDLVKVNEATRDRSLQRAAFRPDLRVAVNIQPGKKLFVTDLTTGTGKFLAELDSYCVAYSHDGKILAAGDDTGGIHLWDATSDPPRPIPGLTGDPGVPLHWLDFSPDGRGLAGKDMEGSVHVWELPTRERTHSWKLPGAPSNEKSLPLRFAADSRHLATLNGNGTIYILRIAPPPDAAKPTTPAEPAVVYPLAWVRHPAKLPGVKSWTIERRNEDGLGNYGVGSSKSYMIAISADGRIAAVASTVGSFHVWETASGKLVQTLPNPGSLMAYLALSPDGRFLAAADDSKTDYGKVRIWDVSTANVLRELPVRGSTDLSWSPDGKHLAQVAHAGDQTLSLWRTSTWEKVPIGENAACHRLGWSPDGKQLAVLLRSHQSWIWDPETGKVLKKVQADGAHGVAWSLDGKILAVAQFEGKSPTLWDASTLERRRQLAPGHHAGSPYYRLIGWLPDGKLLGGTHYDLTLWDAATGNSEAHFNGTNAALSADGVQLVSGQFGYFSMVSPSTGKHLRTLNDPEGGSGEISVSSSAWSKDGKRAAFFDNQKGQLRIWDLEHGEQVIALPELGNKSPARFHPTAWSPDGKWLAVSTKFNDVRLLETDTFTVKSTLPVRATAVAYLPDGKLALGVDKKLEIRDPLGKSLLTLEYHTSIERLDPSPDGRLFVVGGDGKSALWDGKSDSSLTSISGQIWGECAPAWSADGRWLAVATHLRDNVESLTIWNGQTGELVVDHAIGGRLRAISWSAAGEELIYWSPDFGMRRVGRERSGNYLVRSELPGDNGRFLPGGKLLATSRHHTLWLWNAATGAPAGVLAAFPQGRWLAVSPDGHFKGTAGTSKDIVYIVKTEAGPQEVLTPTEFHERFGWKNDPAKATLLKLDGD